MKLIAVFTYVSMAAVAVYGQTQTPAHSQPKQEAMPATNAADPLTAGSKLAFDFSKNNLLKSAQMMPEADYAFKPVPTVRSFGQIVGHVADAQYLFCSVVLGEQNPKPDVEKTKTTKADLIAALNDAFAYCDKAYSGMSDAHAADMVKIFGREMPKLSVLSFDAAHNFEHYGNLVTYLRMKGLVPPSSGGK